ncbi:hypothetical protein PR202_ga16628 [Eleusine coracana subsp. coracana]|uniref:Uncharacterized protein n=1 Tax=Eleusine coracana subsp. coracana TaxID=191504 RepID=A0AAV5CN40_ELECO|nr:hypothetical protein PR202_ga16628 [Eleusine coracana subsp. coracana]
MGKPPSHEAVGFLREAYEQVLRWTYAYVYYLDARRDAAKREFCEFIQPEAEASLEALHHCAERERIDLCQNTDTVITFDQYRTKLAGLTAVTRKYFAERVTMFEGGIAEPYKYSIDSLTTRNLKQWIDMHDGA